MASCPSYFPASCSNCSGSSSDDCNCGYVIERYDPVQKEWRILAQRCTGTCKAPPDMSQDISGAHASFAGMCRLRCCVPAVHVASSGQRLIWYAVGAAAIAVLIYFLYRLIF
ncbi:MAG TPA: hypothetical protein VMN36_14985 [Verrucomicrobiales bacterium]|nr:hypothetical protein [Verrucomicrobiales bacterium]